MSFTPTKKPAVPAAARRTPTVNGTSTANTSGAPSRGESEDRQATPTTATTAGKSSTATSAGLNRTRSVRNGAPVSARAAARKPQTADSAADEDAKAELHARMEELQQQLADAERARDESQKQAAVLQVKLDEAHKEQGMLEETVHEHTERINDLENEKKESLRARREMEQIYESERAAAMKEKDEAVSREEEMQNALQRMKETLAQREMRATLDDDRRPMVSRQSSGGRNYSPSPNPELSDTQFAPPAISRSDSVSRNNSKLVMQKDKIIESLRLELAEAEMKLVEVENMGGGRLQEIQRQLYDVKMHNARLMEENESFQLLLSEKTLNGDFLRAPSHSRPPSRDARSTDGQPQGTTLADELENHDESEIIEGGDEVPRRLQSEVQSLKDQNKALTLYINNIISRLLQHDQFEAILDKTPDLVAGPGAASRIYQEADTDKELPPPPSEKDEQPSLLQRAKSVMGGTRPKPRPLSQSIEQPQRAPSLTEDPQLAPKVPLGRSRSMRQGGHRRANSEWPAASVVTNMYRGPSPGSGPLSPGLTSPVNRNSFFGGPFRQPSGSNVPTISEGEAGKENARDSKMSSAAGNNRNSVISITGGVDDDLPSSGGLAAERSNTSSPPRSTSSSSGQDKDKQSGAVMMGSKPRPLRLVQEAADEDAAKKQANRGSWFGWMNKGGAPPGSITGPPGQGGGLGEKLGGVFSPRKSESNDAQ